jgi:hypothetical protein
MHLHIREQFPNLMDEEEPLLSNWLSPRYSRIYLLYIEPEWIITIGSEASQPCPFCNQSVGRTGYALQRPEITYRFPAGARSFCLLQRIQIGAGRHSELLFKGNIRCSPGVKQMVPTDDNQHPSSVRVKNAWKYSYSSASPPWRGV